MRRDKMREDRGYCKDLILTVRDKEYALLKKDVEALLDNRFVFNRNWDMEPCLVERQILPMNWRTYFDQDPEWAYMLNRQEYLLKFLVAYIVEEDERYIDKLKYYIFDWIESIRLTSPLDVVTRTLDTGIRCATWVKILLFLEDFHLLNEDEKEQICQSIKEQFTFLRTHYRDKYTLSNWGVLQTTAIIKAHHFFGEAVCKKEDVSWALDELRDQLQLQVLEDGTQYEQSPLYHVEVYKAVLEMCLFVPEMTDEFQPILEKMANYIYMMRCPDGATFAIGDSDRNQTDDILNLSALVLNHSRYRVSEHLDLEMICLLGRSGIERFTSLKHSSQLKEAHFFKDSGQVCIKNGESYLFFKCGPLGSAHSHSDENSLCLYYKGQPIFVDAGRYTYTDCKERYDLKSALSHSTCLIDGQTPELITGSWNYQRYPQFLSADYEEKSGFHFMEGIYSGEIDEANYVHKRQILAHFKGIFLVADTIFCKGSHELTSQFILDGGIHYRSDKLGRLQVYSKEEFQVKPTHLSPFYNQLELSTKIVKQANFTDSVTNYSLFADQEFQVKNLPVHSTDGRLFESAIAFEIKGCGESYLLMINGEEMVQGEKCAVVGGRKLRGKCLVYDSNQAKTIRFRG